jgi:hypothetical protein
MVAVSGVVRRRRRKQRCYCLESDYPDTRAGWIQTPSSAPRPRGTCSPSTESTSATTMIATVRCHDVCLCMPCSLSGSELIHHPQRPVCASLSPFLHTIPFPTATPALVEEPAAGPPPLPRRLATIARYLPPQDRARPRDSMGPITEGCPRRPGSTAPAYRRRLLTPLAAVALPGRIEVQRGRASSFTDRPWRAGSGLLRRR